jgi:hypothetical protein
VPHAGGRLDPQGNWVFNGTSSLNSGEHFSLDRELLIFRTSTCGLLARLCRLCSRILWLRSYYATTYFTFASICMNLTTPMGMA